MTGREMDWDAVRAEWLRTADAASAIASAQRQMVLAKRGARVSQAVEALVAIVALAFVGLALRHAANALEAALGVVVGVLIGVAWWRRRSLLREEQRSLEATGIDHLRLARIIRGRQVRLAEFIWIVIALDLVFLIPWWVIGSRVHSRRLSDIGSIETMWLPLLGMAFLAAWAGRARSRAIRDLDGLNPLTGDDRND
jgi:hypothetical protein